jgi:hypothetical protein
MGSQWKNHEHFSEYHRTFPILTKYKFNFIPKILEWNDEGYRYEYVDGVTIQESLDDLTGPVKLTQKLIFEMKIAMDDIWKKLYQISIENLNDEFLWYRDPHLGNLIWKNDTKELILLDIDSFQITKYIPISNMNNIFIQQLETRYLLERRVC